MSRGPVFAAVCAALALCAGDPFPSGRGVCVSGAVADTLLAVDPPPVWLAPEAPSREQGFRWKGSLGAGYDAFTQTYRLGAADTTETLSETVLTVGAEGLCAGRSDHRWRLAPSFSVGSERTRQSLQAGWTHRPDGGPRRADARLDLQAVQYRGTTDYALSSDSGEGRLRLRWFPAPEGAVGGDLRLEGRALRHADPSDLQVDRQELLAVAGLRSGADAADPWSAALRVGRRAHPDSSRIDRTSVGLDLELERFALEGPTWRAFLRSERRVIRDASVRPSGWSHWGGLDLGVPLSPVLDAVLELQWEWWDYDRTVGAYLDQVRWQGLAGVRAPGLEGPGWSLGLAWETFGSDDAAERYRQLGLRGGLEHYGDRLGLSATVEIGRRDYDADGGTATADADALYTDFASTEVWLNASWRADARLDLHALASWIPESHARDEDDQSLGFLSLYALLSF